MSAIEPAEVFAKKTAASLADGTFVRLALSRPAAPESPQKILGRAIKLRGELQLSITRRYATRDVTENQPLANVAAWLQARLGGEFHSALLGTTTRDWQFICTGTGAARLIDHKPAKTNAPTHEHDQKKSGWLDVAANDWLIGLGILDRDGRLRASMADKHRQINHYIEILSHLCRECGWDAAIELNQNIHLVDMGCGKGYLTFGLWHLFARKWKRAVRVTGIEARADLVATTNRLAKQLSAPGLEFVRGEIATAKLEKVDGLIALHACNTATDDAIRQGIGLGAKLIVVAPCCHQEIRPQLGRPEPLAGVVAHGIMAERLAEWATDGLRALFLEWAGYRTKVLEFVAGAHTPKNLMIAAVREREPFTDPKIRNQIMELKSFLQIKQHALDSLVKPK